MHISRNAPPMESNSRKAVVSLVAGAALTLPVGMAMAAPVVTGGLVNVTVVDVASGNTIHALNGVTLLVAATLGNTTVQVLAANLGPTGQVADCDASQATTTSVTQRRGVGPALEQPPTGNLGLRPGGSESARRDADRLLQVVISPRKRAFPCWPRPGGVRGCRIHWVELRSGDAQICRSRRLSDSNQRGPSTPSIQSVALVEPR